MGEPVKDLNKGKDNDIVGVVGEDIQQQHFGWTVCL